MKMDTMFIVEIKQQLMVKRLLQALVKILQSILAGMECTTLKQQINGLQIEYLMVPFQIHHFLLHNHVKLLISIYILLILILFTMQEWFNLTSIYSL